MIQFVHKEVYKIEVVASHCYNLPYIVLVTALRLPGLGPITIFG